MSEPVNHPDTISWSTPRTLAAKRVAVYLEQLGDRDPEARSRAEDIIAIVLDVLGQPDRDMIDEGVSALDRATGWRRPIEQRELVELIFRAMLGRAG